MPLNLIEGQYAPGDPLCIDLAADDLTAAQDFYGRLFGWEFRDVDDHLWALKGDRLAAGFGLFEALDLVGPRWWLVLAAPRLDELRNDADDAGLSVVGQVSLGELGQAAVVEDPAGAKAVLWEPRRLEPGVLGATHGGLVGSELVTPHPETVAPLYQRLFDLEAVTADDGAIILQRRELEVPRAIFGVVPAAGAAKASQVGARWRPYLQVDGLDAFLLEAERLGAQVADRRVTASRRATAVLIDPQGAELGVVEGKVST